MAEVARPRARLRAGQRLALDAMGITRWVGRDSAGDAGPDDAVATTPPAQAAIDATLAPTGIAAAVAADTGGVVQGVAGDAVAGLERLRLEVAACTRCRLHATRTQTVFGVGNPQATWMVVGEAPGAEEDRQGEPFVGRAGQLLNEMIRAIGLSREGVYIANVLKCRPPENRDPKPDESENCENYLQQQIMLVRPRILLAVGRIAAQNLLKTDTPIGRLRGQVHHYGPLDTPLVVTYHPAYLLRSPGQKRRAWEDLVLARRTVQAG